LVITPKGGKVVTIPLALRTGRAIDLAVGERSDGPLFLAARGRHGSPPTVTTMPARLSRPPGW
jgi:integrase/recombinase XerD